MDASLKGGESIQKQVYYHCYSLAVFDIIADCLEVWLDDAVFKRVGSERVIMGYRYDNINLFCVMGSDPVRMMKIL